MIETHIPAKDHECRHICLYCKREYSHIPTVILMCWLNNFGDCGCRDGQILMFKEVVSGD